MSEGISYTEPKLCSYKGDITKQWFIYFNVKDIDLNITKRIQHRNGINALPTVKLRMQFAAQEIAGLKRLLKNGWNPFIQASINNLSRMRFNEALDFGLSKCQLAKKSAMDYKGTVNFFKKAACKLRLDNALITGIKKQHIMLLLDVVKETRTWSNHAYNKNLGYLSAVLGKLVDYEVIDHNPAYKIKNLPVAETHKFETITDAEKYAIKAYLLDHNPAFFTYLMVIYHTGIRPKEALCLQVSDVRFERRTIIIKPDIERENSKTKTIRMVPVNDHLAALLLRHVGSSSGNYYVFGSMFKSGIGARGAGSQDHGNIRGAMMKENFLPSENMMKRDTATKLWKKLIIDELKIKKFMYAMKHTGADDKILAGISLDALREMYGHTSKYMTEKYARKVKEVYKEEILKQSPGFI